MKLKGYTKGIFLLEYVEEEWEIIKKVSMASIIKHSNIGMANKDFIEEELHKLFCCAENIIVYKHTMNYKDVPQLSVKVSDDLNTLVITVNGEFINESEIDPEFSKETDKKEMYYHIINAIETVRNKRQAIIDKFEVVDVDDFLNVEKMKRIEE